jgi:site-specific recombinase XerD
VGRQASAHAAAWVEELHRRDLSAGTVAKYRMSVTAWETWLAPRQVFEATSDDVARFVDGRKVGARTRYQWLSVLGGFYSWAIRHGLTDTDPTAAVRRPRLHGALPRPIGDSDLAYALAVAGPEMRAWLLCGALAGMRCAEIAGLKRPDVIEGQARIRILGKGRKERIVPLHPELLSALRCAGLPRTGPVFTRPLGGPWSPPSVSRTISAFFTDIGVDATAHQLRHWFATQTYSRSGDLLVVQNLLGHSSPTTTSVYTAWSRPAAEAAVEALALPV